MTNAELIEKLHRCIPSYDGCSKKCEFFNEPNCHEALINAAADALEADDKRIARLEEDLKTREAEREVMQDTIKICEEAADRYKAELPKEGEWIDLFGHDYKCSVCGEWYRMDGTPEQEDMNYCPNCGAKMKGEQK